MCTAYYRYGAAMEYRRHGYHGRSFRSIPVNIEEKENSFELYLFAPALEKKNFHITVLDDVLNISYEPVEKESDETKIKFTRREYGQHGFERRFFLNGKVEVDKISASYANGVLAISLPKNPEMNKPAKDVSIT